jgi:hypothetical protein
MKSVALSAYVLHYVISDGEFLAFHLQTCHRSGNTFTSAIAKFDSHIRKLLSKWKESCAQINLH